MRDLFQIQWTRKSFKLRPKGDRHGKSKRKSFSGSKVSKCQDPKVDNKLVRCRQGRVSSVPGIEKQEEESHGTSLELLAEARSYKTFGKGVSFYEPGHHWRFLGGGNDVV